MLGNNTYGTNVNSWAVVVARLEEQLLPIPAVRILSSAKLAALSGCFGLELAGFKNLTFIGRLSTKSREQNPRDNVIIWGLLDHFWHML